MERGSIARNAESVEGGGEMGTGGGGQRQGGEVDFGGRRGERVLVIIICIIHTFVVRSSRRFCCNMRTSGSLRVTTGPHRTSDSPLSGTPSAPASPSGNFVASSGRSTHTGVGCCVRDQYPRSSLRRGIRTSGRKEEWGGGGGGEGGVLIQPLTVITCREHC